MAEQTVVEKMSQLQVDQGKKVMFTFCDGLYLSHISQLAANAPDACCHLA